MGSLAPPVVTRAEVAGKALFSTILGQIAPRPVPDPLEPVIARSPDNVKPDGPRHVDRFVESLRSDFPEQCKDIYVGYYTIGDYFDPSDIARLGEDYLTSALHTIAEENSTAVLHFAYDWCQQNPQSLQQICSGTSLREMFSPVELSQRGELFLTLTLILIRNALEITAKLQMSRAEKLVTSEMKPGSERSSSAENASGAIEKAGRHTRTSSDVLDSVQSHANEALDSKAPKGLYRVELRQPRPDQKDHEPTSAAFVGTCRFRSYNQASGSVQVTPLVSHKSPRQGQKQAVLRTTPRTQHHAPANEPPPHQRRQAATPRMSAMAPGFTPQGPLDPSRGLTPQIAPAQLYLGNMPLILGPPQNFHPALDIRPNQSEPSHGYSGYSGMHPNASDFHMNQEQAYAQTQTGPHLGYAGSVHSGKYMAFPGPYSHSTLPPTLSNLTNVPFSAPTHDQPPRRASGPGPRHDFGHRPQHKQIGKPSRGGRRNSVRGNYHGPTNHHPPNTGQSVFHGNPQFQQPPPTTTTEPFPPFTPVAEGSHAPELRPRFPDDRVVHPSVWVYNIRDRGKDRGNELISLELKEHFQNMLCRPVLDVKVNRDKYDNLYAHVSFYYWDDAGAALTLHDTLYYDRPLTVKVPNMQLHRQAMRQQQYAMACNLKMAQPRSAHIEPALASRHMASASPGGTGILTAPVGDRKRSTVDRRASGTTIKHRHRGCSRTYEASADNPMSYSPQDVRRIQPVQPMLCRETVEDVAQFAAVQNSLSRPKAPVIELEERPDSRASSTKASKRKNHTNIMRRDRSSTRSRSNTATPELSAAGIAHHGPSIRKDTPDNFTATAREGMVDKSITTIQEGGEQEKACDKTAKVKQELEKPSPGKSSLDRKTKRPKKGGKRGKASEESAPEPGEDCKSKETGAYASEPLNLSKPQPDASACSSGPLPAGPEKPWQIQRAAKVAVPDITLHSRKENQGAYSVASSTGRVSYAQAAAAVGVPTSVTSAAAVKPPAFEKDAESRYFTPMEIPSSPSTKSEKTLAPATPLSMTGGHVGELTPEKDDSFVTVQEEPAFILNSSVEHENVAQESREQGTNNEGGNTETDNVSFGSSEQVEHTQKDSALHTAPETIEYHPPSVKQATAPMLVTSSNYADDATSRMEHDSADGRLETEENRKTAKDQGRQCLSVSQSMVKPNAPDTGSIHPNARQKGNKKTTKKGKSCGKGKKAYK